MVLAGDVFDRLLEIEDGSVDLLAVDPPYGILGEQGEEWDAFPTPDALMSFTRLWLEAALPKLKPTGRLFVCFSQWHVHRLRAVLDELGGARSVRFALQQHAHLALQECPLAAERPLRAGS